MPDGAIGSGTINGTTSAQHDSNGTTPDTTELTASGSESTSPTLAAAKLDGRVAATAEAGRPRKTGGTARNNRDDNELSHIIHETVEWHLSSARSITPEVQAEVAGLLALLPTVARPRNYLRLWTPY